MNEKKAIELCLGYHDPIGFEYLVKKFGKEAFYHAYSFTGNEEDALDICQESFSKAFKAIPGIKHLDKFYPWFYQILKNSSINFLRRKKNLKLKTAEIFQSSNSESNTPQKVLEDEDNKKKIWDIIFSLKTEFREILVLKYVDGKNYNELSEILNIPRGTVMSRLYNARKSFKEKYLRGGK